MKAVNGRAEGGQWKNGGVVCVWVLMINGKDEGVRCAPLSEMDRRKGGNRLQAEEIEAAAEKKKQEKQDHEEEK